MQEVFDGENEFIGPVKGDETVIGKEHECLGNMFSYTHPVQFCNNILQQKTSDLKVSG